MKIEFKTKKEFIQKVGILLLGIPNGVFVGLVWYILMENGPQYFLKWKFFWTMIWFVVLGGIIFGYLWGNALWNIFTKKNK